MTEIDADARPTTGAGTPASQQASWWPVHEFINAAVAQANTTLPLAGTPAWQALGDGDPRKLLAVAVAGEHHVLRVETAQTAMSEASREISKAADWSQMSHPRSGVYIPREVA